MASRKLARLLLYHEQNDMKTHDMQLELHNRLKKITHNLNTKVLNSLFMKNYNIQKHDGNINNWEKTFTVTGSTKITPEQADDFNSRFETTGIKYVKAHTAKHVTEGMVSQTSPAVDDNMDIPKGKPHIETAKDSVTGQDIDVTHSFQKPGTATETDHGTLAIKNGDGNAITDNATALQDDTVKVVDDGQAESRPTEGGGGDLK